MNQGWVRKKLKDCFKLKSGDGLTAKNMIPGDYPVFGGNSQTGTHNTFNLSGDNIIVGRVGALCGNARHITENIWLTDNAFKIMDKKYEFDNNFLTYLLNYNNLRSFARQAAQPVISNSSLKDLELDFPTDVEEQKRITAILDQAFDDLEQTRAKTEQNLKNARELFDSYLQQVFSQKGEGWVESELHVVSKDLLQGINTSTDKTVFVDSGIPILQAKELANRSLNLLKCKFVSVKDFEDVNDRYKPNKGDLLLNNIGSSLGRCVCVDWDFAFTIAWNVMRIVPNRDIILPEYLRYVISSPLFQKTIWSKTKGVGMPFISKKNLIEIKVSYPSLKSQLDIVEALDDVHKETTQLIGLYQTKLDCLEELKKSILQKAFSGELNAKA
mgnify:CR=1 FL=1